MEHHSLSQIEFWKPFLREIHQDCSTQGITLKVRHRDRTLHLLLESPKLLSRKEWVTSIQSNIQKYLSTVGSPLPEPFGIQQMLIYGKSTGKRYPSWKAVLAVPASSSEPSEPASRLSSSSSSSSTSASSFSTSTLPSSSSLASRSSSSTASSLSQSVSLPNEPSPTDPVPPGSAPVPFHSKAIRLIRPAAMGMKDLLPPSIRDRLSDAVSSHPNLTPHLWATEELTFLGSQGWIARGILGFFALSLMVYLYLGSWFVPQQSKQLNALQPEVARLETLEPRNLAELTQLIEDLDVLIEQLQSLSWVSGIFYKRAQAQANTLNDRYDRLQHRLELEQLGQTYLATAKHLAAQATLSLERSPNPDVDLRRQIQQQWLAANYWLTLIPAQTFAATDAQRLQAVYQKNYWNQSVVSDDG